MISRQDSAIWEHENIFSNDYFREMRRCTCIHTSNRSLITQVGKLKLTDMSMLIGWFVKYTWYGEIGTAIVRCYQKSVSASGTLDINIWGQMGHKSLYSNDTVFNKISAILIFVSNATTYQRIEIQDMLNNAYLGPPIFICKIDFYAE